MIHTHRKPSKHKSCTGCLWNWKNPSGLEPGCYCNKSPKYHRSASGGCTEWTGEVKSVELRSFYGAMPSKHEDKVYHNRRAMR